MRKYVGIFAVLQLVVLWMLTGCDNATSGDENHDPTDLSLSSTSVAENASAGTAVGTFAATDEDDGDIFTFLLVSGGTDNASFSIDGYSLKTNEVFDYEIKSSYSIMVQVDDGNGGTFEKALTIAVTNLTEFGIYTERTVESQADFEVYVWNAGETVTLDGQYTDAFEGSTGWRVTDNGVGWNGWGLYAANAPDTLGYDLSAFENGSLHCAIKGTSPDVGIAVLPMAGTETYVMASAYGYTANAGWVELTIPLSAFNLGTNISTVSYFIAFLQTADNGGYQSLSEYIIDDVYFVN